MGTTPVLSDVSCQPFTAFRLCAGVSKPCPVSSVTTPTGHGHHCHPDLALSNGDDYSGSHDTHLIAVMQLYMLCLSEVLSTSLSLSPAKHSSTLPNSLVSLKKSFW